MLKTELEKLLDKCLLPSEEKSLQDPAVRSYSQLASNHHPHHPLPNLLWQLGPERAQPQPLFQAYHKGPSVSSTSYIHALSPDLDREYKSISELPTVLSLNGNTGISH